MDNQPTAAAPEKILYTAVATAKGGRDGRVASEDGVLDLAVGIPKSMGGNGAGTNPEQLFASGYAACFGSALGFVARAKKVNSGPISVRAEVGIGPKAGGLGYSLAVKLVVSIPELERETGLALVHAAHAVCPYSNATRGNIPVTLELATTMP